MANRIIMLTSITIDGVAIPGATGLEVSEAVGKKLARSDAEYVDTSSDAVHREFTGALLFTDEAVDLVLMTGTTKVLIATYLVEGGATRTLTVGRVASGSGLKMVRSVWKYDSQAGRTPDTRIEFRAVFGTVTKTFGTGVEQGNGTALCSIA